MDVISLTQKLISFNTVDPPGNEAPAARYIGELLDAHGFKVEYSVYGENRLHIVAEKGLNSSCSPIILSGHLDTVPAGAGKWDDDPFIASIKGDRLYGRGSSDMKSGIAAMIIASISAFEDSRPVAGLRLIFTSAEENGCQGCRQMIQSYRDLGRASGIIVGEPTGNIPAIGHKGALYLKAVTSGKTAHSSMPHLGDNAIYKAARAITKIENLKFTVEKDPLLGFPTMNVGKISGGLNINSVPEHTEFTIDIRSTRYLDHIGFLDHLREELGPETSLEKLVDLGPVYSSANNPFIQTVYKVCMEFGISPENPQSMPYVTDGSVLQPFYKGVPTIILGPGQPEMAHKMNEFCYISRLQEAVDIYKKIILTWKP